MCGYRISTIAFVVVKAWKVAAIETELVLLDVRRTDTTAGCLVDLPLTLKLPQGGIVESCNADRPPAHWCKWLLGK